MLNVLLKTVTAYFLSHLNQPYLCKLYLALLSTGYFGLLRVGELTSGTHPIRVSDVHLGRNKNKVLFILRSSKTYGEYTHPQTIKISQQSTHQNRRNSQQLNNGNLCPYYLLRDFIKIRPKFLNPCEPFFTFSDHSPVKPDHLSKMLKMMLRLSNFDEKKYSVHGLRSGRALDLLKLGVSVESIKQIGRWKSNGVFTYLKSL